VKSTLHSVITSTSPCGCIKKDKGSYQLQRYLKEPAGYEARLVIGAAPAQSCIDLVDSSKKNGKRNKATRKTAMRKKIRAIERKIGEL
jgi:hypothetical protein